MNRTAALTELRQSLLDTAGGYLRNTLHIPGTTCQMCAKPVAGYQFCLKCEGYTGRADTADLVGSMIYGWDGSQSGRLMYGYKSAAPGPSHRQILRSLILLGLRGHRGCADVLVGGRPATHWAAVPSLRRVGWAHPFRELLTQVIKTGAEINIVAAQTIRTPRDLTPTNFEVRSAIPDGVHVMVFDDTWTSGGHAQSVAAALKRAGAQTVSILTVARWLDLGETLSKRFHREHVRDRPYDPCACPWTGGHCPT